MAKLNATSSFILLGFSNLHCNPSVLFFVMLVVYTFTLVGNLLLLSSITFSPQLHIPMYFFLANLSVVDISFSTVTVPKLLSGIHHGLTSISFLGCFLQVFFFLALGTTETFLLAAMAFDRYLAICNPLRYSSVMSKRLCVILAIICWAAPLPHSFLYDYTLSHLAYCGKRLIRHFFCDVTQLIELSCSAKYQAELLIHTEGSVFTAVPFLLILTSYSFIIRAVLKLKSTSSRGKAFSSCSSHLTVVGLFYGTVFFIYFCPSSNSNSEYNHLISVGYTIFTPMLNPFIYSLRNQDVKNTLRKSIEWLYSVCDR